MQHNRALRALGLLTVFLLYQVMVTGTMHTHYDNGVVVEHSHPFSGQHSHTSSQLLAIGNLSSPFDGQASVCHVPSPLRLCLAPSVVAQATPIARGSGIRLALLRAPPF